VSPAESAAIVAILARIDAAVGAPESETQEEHDARRAMVQRDHDARVIRRGLTSGGQ
jgi:hypothetical protein